MPRSHLDDSEEMKDLMGEMPHWLISRGITLLVVLTTLALVGLYFVQYPDIISSPVTITTDNPTVRIIAQNSGRISKIFVKNDQEVFESESLGLIENTAVYSDVIYLSERLPELAASVDSGVKALADFRKNLQVGPLQDSYINLHRSITDYLFFTEQNFQARQIEQLRIQIDHYQELNSKLTLRDKQLNEQLLLEKERFSIDSALYAQNVISQTEFIDVKAKYISKKVNAKQTEITIVENKVIQAKYEKDIEEIKFQKIQMERDYKTRIQTGITKLQSEIINWKHGYLLISPQPGKVLFNKFWNENQFVQKNEVVFLVVPRGQKLICRASVPSLGAGKIEPGQRTLIRLSAYPYEEYGAIAGIVKSISPIPLDSNYSMEIELSNGLVTNRKNILPATSLLEGEVLVITREKSVLDRLFDQVFKLTRGDLNAK